MQMNLWAVQKKNVQLDVNCGRLLGAWQERLTDYIEMWIVSPVRGTSNYFIDVMEDHRQHTYTHGSILAVFLSHYTVVIVFKRNYCAGKRCAEWAAQIIVL